MNIRETEIILGMMKTAYPSFYKNIATKEAQDAVKLWATMFESDPVNIVLEAIKGMICVLRYPPTIADVKEKIYQIVNSIKDTELEAWGLVLSAIENANYYADECFNNLPPMIRKIIGSPNQLREWAMMDSETVNSVIQSNFMRSYTARSRQDENYRMMPESTRKMIADLSNKLSMPKQLEGVE